MLAHLKKYTIKYLKSIWLLHASRGIITQNLHDAIVLRKFLSYHDADDDEDAGGVDADTIDDDGDDMIGVGECGSKAAVAWT